MNRKLLTEAVHTLRRLAMGHKGTLAPAAARSQFNALLEHAKLLYPERVDIQALGGLSGMDGTIDTCSDSIGRLSEALELRAPEDLSERARLLPLPTDLPDSVLADVAELQLVVDGGANKAALLLAGSIAESLLLFGHPDTSERGPGLAHLVKECRDSRRFGRDTLRHLDSLIDYRDLIHPRSGVRNGIACNLSRVESAITALSLLCAELVDEQRVSDSTRGA